MKNQIEIYRAKDGQPQIEVLFDNESFWLSLEQISDLFERDKSVVSRHISKTYNEGELDKQQLLQKMQRFKLRN